MYLIEKSNKIRNCRQFQYNRDFNIIYILDPTPGPIHGQNRNQGHGLAHVRGQDQEASIHDHHLVAVLIVEAIILKRNFVINGDLILKIIVRQIQICF